jgi:hypothetical protein
MAIDLMVEAIRTSETSVCFKETKQHYVPEGCHLQPRRREYKFSLNKNDEARNKLVQRQE